MAKKVWTFVPKKHVQHIRHSKSQTSFNKGSSQYIKKYRGQGR